MFPYDNRILRSRGVCDCCAEMQILTPHTAWNTHGPSRDAVGQIIKGGIDHGFFDIEKASTLFDVPTKTVMAWANGELPARKQRIKVWKAIKRHIGQPPSQG